MELYWILTAAGLGVSVLSALESRVQWIASFCALFGEGCRRTEDFTLLRIPISWWGLAYYALLAAVLFFRPRLAFWAIMAGLGFELTFLRIMVSIRAFCIFCMLNAVVVAALVWASFEPARIWQAAALALLFFELSYFFISRENVSRMSPGRKAPPEAAVAEVDGEVITREDLERPLSRKIYKLEKEIYRLKRDRLEKMIRDILLSREAERRQVSKQQLIDRVANGRRQPSDDEKREAARDFARDLEESREVKVHLKKPTPPAVQVDIEGRPWLGAEDAPVVVVEFSDPLCPACRAANETTARIREEYEDRIRWVFKDFPLDTHPGAKKAAEAAHCAGEQGKFWEYHDMVVESGEEAPDDGRLKEYADSLDLQSEPFARCLEQGKYRTRIEEDIRHGKAAGISAIPAFVVNGRVLSGNLSFDEFSKAVEEELKAAAAPSESR